MLLSSGLDGLVYAWELNNSTEQGCTYQRLLYMPGLMRCRLAPDESRLVLCTGTGYLMLVHDLDLASLAGDLVDFRVSVTKMLLKTNRPTTHPLISALCFPPQIPQPNIQRLNLMRKQRVPLGARKTPAVSHRRKRNRIEFVSDFPPGDDAEMISGLTVCTMGRWGFFRGCCTVQRYAPRWKRCNLRWSGGGRKQLQHQQHREFRAESLLNDRSALRNKQGLCTVLRMIVNNSENCCLFGRKLLSN